MYIDLILFIVFIIFYLLVQEALVYYVLSKSLYIQKMDKNISRCLSNKQPSVNNQLKYIKLRDDRNSITGLTIGKLIFYITISLFFSYRISLLSNINDMIRFLIIITLFGCAFWIFMNEFKDRWIMHYTLSTMMLNFLFFGTYMIVMTVSPLYIGNYQYNILWLFFTLVLFSYIISLIKRRLEHGSNNKVWKKNPPPMV